MKKIIFIGLLLFCISAESMAQSRVPEIREILLNKKQTEVLVVAHRGDWRNFCENSIEAVESAIEMGVDIVEIDLQKTKDGHLIVMHDSKLDRTTTGKGLVSETTLAEIKQLKLKNGCSIKTKGTVPTLEEILCKAKGKIMINLDKADRYFDDVFPLLEKTETKDQIIMKGGQPYEQVKQKYGKYLDQIIYMPVVKLDDVNSNEIIEDYLKKMKPIAFELVYSDANSNKAIQVKKELTGKSLIWYNTLWDTLCAGHDDDLGLENPDLAYGYLIHTLGASIIQTDRPQYLLNYLRKNNLHK